MTLDATTEPLLVVDDLAVEFRTDEGVVKAVDGAAFTIDRGEIVGVVGESGSGKSVTAMSILGLVKSGRRVRGAIRFRGRDLAALPAKELRAIRGAEIAMIFQDPMTALNPVVTIGRQIVEALRLHDKKMSKAAARDRAIELLALVGMPDAPARFKQYPHEFSGGMRQRAMIAMAIANGPSLLIADEPTTALDVTIQAQVLDLLKIAQQETQAATLLITHDLGVVAELADRVVVMYAGRVVEQGDVTTVFTAPRHPYTVGLLESLPRLDRDVDELHPIPGSPPSLLAPPPGCPFHPRCPLARDRCRTERPDLRVVGNGTAIHRTACHFAEELAGVPTEVTR
ncbi:ABC transporter ATP-binding protein [Jiangella mangrovi]|uniref:Oligopeptide/dipeptide ABC transporter ATP-binding protein n=1 Tax=Jiangella mangrovi TaxID=1524084 RepID=A0A7W9LIV3_9ACTN|nr:ABC transporter ATP-binding protein [Jiangella mangrovi]MBB5785441.1 oligopeptide/dipeptide ABC transporter ATP-binding protein [Jiangella mangrovi]